MFKSFSKYEWDEMDPSDRQSIKQYNNMVRFRQEYSMERVNGDIEYSGRKSLAYTDEEWADLVPKARRLVKQHNGHLRISRAVKNEFPKEFKKLYKKNLPLELVPDDFPRALTEREVEAVVYFFSL